MEIHLAPMENVTCFAFRKLCLGATDSYTGMFSLSNLTRRNNTWSEIDTFQIEGQRQWIQVATSKEKECSEFLRKLNLELKSNPSKDNVYGIQLNLSCPSRDLIRLGQGAALIKRPTKVVNLIKELLKQDKFKVGLKLRLGLNNTEGKQRKIIALFQELEKINNPNFSSVVVHFKNANDKSQDKCDFSLLKELALFKLPLIINGGIASAEDYHSIVRNVPDRKNILGIMVGRKALQNPRCFIDLNKNLNKKEISPTSSISLKEEFQSNCKEHLPRQIYLDTIKKHCSWSR
jgi:tRNA-dihydrouridine synthase